MNRAAFWLLNFNLFKEIEIQSVKWPNKV